MIRHTNISEKTYKLLCKRILGRELPPGTRLVEEQLAAELGVSRTPLREAINRLVQAGFVTVEPRRGAYVRVFELKDAVELFDVREVLEGLAARQATGRLDRGELEALRGQFESADAEAFLTADTDLHKMIISNCDNRYLRDMLNNLYSLVQVFRVAGYGSPQRSARAAEDHREIIKALLAEDAALAEELMSRHIRTTKQQIVREFEEQEAEAVGG